MDIKVSMAALTWNIAFLYKSGANTRNQFNLFTKKYLVMI